MSDQIYLHGMQFEGHHGVTDDERSRLQIIELDVQLSLDLRAAGQSDDLAQTVDYGDVFDVCRDLVEQRSFHLLEGLAETVAADLLARFPAIESVVVRAKKSGVPRDGIVDYAGVRIERTRHGR